MIYIGYNLSSVNRNKAYVYLSKEGWMSAVICHNPYLFYSNGEYNFDIPISDVVVVFKIKKRSLLSRVKYFFKKQFA